MFNSCRIERKKPVCSSWVSFASPDASRASRRATGSLTGRVAYWIASWSSGTTTDPLRPATAAAESAAQASAPAVLTRVVRRFPAGNKSIELERSRFIVADNIDFGFCRDLAFNSDSPIGRIYEKTAESFAKQVLRRT